MRQESTAISSGFGIPGPVWQEMMTCMTIPPDGTAANPDASDDTQSDDTQSDDKKSVSPPGGESPDPDAAPDLDNMKEADRAQDRSANVTEWR